MRKNSGFTLIELLVVIIIVGVLAAIALPRFMASVENARAAEVMNFMGSVREQANTYASTHSGTVSTDFTTLGFSTGSGVTISGVGNVTATLKYWTVTISAAGLQTGIRTGAAAGSNTVTLSLDGTWAGDYWGKTGNPSLPSA